MYLTQLNMNISDFIASRIESITRTKNPNSNSNSNSNPNSNPNSH